MIESALRDHMAVFKHKEEILSARTSCKYNCHDVDVYHLKLGCSKDVHGEWMLELSGLVNRSAP